MIRSLRLFNNGLGPLEQTDDMWRRRSAAAVVPPTKPGWLIGAVPCKIGAPVTGFVLAQGTHQTGCEIAVWESAVHAANWFRQRQAVAAQYG